MSNLVIIVTRMSGTDENEFQKYCPACDCWAIKNLCQPNSRSIIPSNEALIFNSGDNFLIVDGFAISNDPATGDNFLIVDGFAINNYPDKCNLLKNYITDAYNNGKKITMLIHPGTEVKTLDKAIQIIFGNTQANITKKIEISQYRRSLKISFDPNDNKYLIDTSDNPPKEVKC